MARNSALAKAEARTVPWPVRTRGDSPVQMLAGVERAEGPGKLDTHCVVKTCRGKLLAPLAALARPNQARNLPQIRVRPLVQRRLSENFFRKLHCLECYTFESYHRKLTVRFLLLFGV